jgi:dephospho-CoA kinase
MKSINPIKVAITGGIGSGKSTFTNFLVSDGYTVIKADPLAKEILVKNPSVIKQIKKHFGNDIYKKNGSLDRELLAQRSFKSKASVKLLNSIVHPAVIKEVKSLFNKYKQQNIIFVEAALIYEAKMKSLFDYVVLITADEKIRIRRAVEKNNLTVESVKSRMQNQIPDEKKKLKADFVFENNGTKKELKAKSKMLVKLLLSDK